MAKKGLTVAQIYQTISGKLTTEKTAATLSLDGTDVDISIINETDVLDYDNFMDLEIEATTMKEDGTQKDSGAG